VAEDGDLPRFGNLEPASEPLGPVDLESRLREARARRTQALAHRGPPDPDGVHPDAAATAPPGPRNSPATTSGPGREITPAGTIAIVLGILVGGTVTASLAPLLNRVGPAPVPNLSVAILATPTAARLEAPPAFPPLANLLGETRPPALVPPPPDQPLPQVAPPFARLAVRPEPRPDLLRAVAASKTRAAAAPYLTSLTLPARPEWSHSETGSSSRQLTGS
jgi:hypothetical protein